MKKVKIVFGAVMFAICGIAHGGTFVDDFEDQDLSEWTIGGSQSNGFSTSVVDRNSSFKGRAAQFGAGDVYFSRTFEYIPSMRFRFEMEVLVDSGSDFFAEDYRYMGAMFIFRDSGDNELGRVGYFYASKSDPIDDADARGDWNYNEISSGITANYDLSESDLLSQITPLAGTIDSVELRFYVNSTCRGCVSGRGGQVWADDVNIVWPPGIVLRSASSGQWQIDQMSGFSLGSSTTPSLFSNQDFEFMAATDFDKDGDNDVLVRNSVSGSWRIFEMEEGVVNTQHIPDLFSALEWEFQFAGDADGDRDADIVLRSNVTGAWRIFTMEDNTRVGLANLAGWKNLTWTFVGSGDFDDDEDIDFVLRNTSTGAWRIFEVDSGGIVAVNNPIIWKNLDFEYRGIGDTDADGDADILVQNTTTLGWRIYNINNFTLVGVFNPRMVQSSDWEYKGMSDFDADGDLDVVMRILSTNAWRIFEIETNASQGATNPGLTTTADLQFQGIAE